MQRRKKFAPKAQTRPWVCTSPDNPPTCRSSGTREESRDQGYPSTNPTRTRSEEWSKADWDCWDCNRQSLSPAYSMQNAAMQRRKYVRKSQQRMHGKHCWVGTEQCIDSGSAPRESRRILRRIGSCLQSASSAHSSACRTEFGERYLCSSTKWADTEQCTLSASRSLRRPFHRADALPSVGCPRR